MANVNEARVFSNEGHTVIFESMYEDEQWYWKVQEIKDSAEEILTYASNNLWRDS